MKQFYSAKDINDLEGMLQVMRTMKKNPLAFHEIGGGHTLALLFFNPSLRTRMSTERAAYNLGMDVIHMDMKNSWAWELEDGTMMNGTKAEHIKEASNVICRYADIVAIRSFASLLNKADDDKDELITKFMALSDKPVINLESTLRHPLQSLTDLYTIRDKTTKKSPKIVLSWAPHPKPLPHTVALSFLEWMCLGGHQVTVTHPRGYELDPSFMQGHAIEYDQKNAFREADFIYVKNWSSAQPYGQVMNTEAAWTITKDLMSLTDQAALMHCLPVRRNMVIADDALDSTHSIIYEQAENRLYAAQAVLYHILKQIES